MVVDAHQVGIKYFTQLTYVSSQAISLREFIEEEVLITLRAGMEKPFSSSNKLLIHFMNRNDKINQKKITSYTSNIKYRNEFKVLYTYIFRIKFRYFHTILHSVCIIIMNIDAKFQSDSSSSDQPVARLNSSIIKKCKSLYLSSYGQ